MTEDDERHGTTAGYNAHRRSKSDPCEPCLQAKRDQGAEHRRRQALQSPVRITTPCGWCGQATTSKVKVCSDCRGIELRVSRGVEMVGTGLTGGRWVVQRGIQRWVANQPAKPPPEPLHASTEEILALAAAEHGVTPTDIVAPGRDGVDRVAARKTAILLLRWADESFNDIARLMNRGRSTIVASVADSLGRPDLVRTAKRLRAQLEQGQVAA